jgi:hypothetical protein
LTEFIYSFIWHLSDLVPLIVMTVSPCKKLSHVGGGKTAQGSFTLDFHLDRASAMKWAWVLIAQMRFNFLLGMLVQGLILHANWVFFFVLFFNLWCTYVGDDSLEGLTRFDWSLERKVEKFKNIAIFSWTSRTYCWNLVISEKKSSTHFLHENPLYDDPH